MREGRRGQEEQESGPGAVAVAISAGIASCAMHAAAFARAAAFALFFLKRKRCRGKKGKRERDRCDLLHREEGREEERGEVWGEVLPVRGGANAREFKQGRGCRGHGPQASTKENGAGARHAQGLNGPAVVGVNQQHDQKSSGDRLMASGKVTRLAAV